MFNTLIGVILIIIGVIGLGETALAPSDSLETLLVSGVFWGMMWFGFYCVIIGYREK